MYEDKSIIAYAHMMKTGGTSFSKTLIQHFGNKMHAVPAGVIISKLEYNKNKFEKDLKRFKGNLKLITGHPMRPHIDFGKYSDNLMWTTFFRNPEKRYLSHYLHDLNYESKNGFSCDRFDIEEWQNVRKNNNYQTRFIAGEENLQKAIDIIETKFNWVGILEDYENSMYSFREQFELNNLHLDFKRTNSALETKEFKKEVKKKYSDFIKENNKIDNELYKYVVENVYPRFKLDDKPDNIKGKPGIIRDVNMLKYFVKRLESDNVAKINSKNIKKFMTRWF